MHELSIAQNIVDIVKNSVEDKELEAVTGIKLKIGTGAGVVTDSLEFSFEAIKNDSKLSNAKLEIESVPFCVQCNICNKITVSEMGMIICENCGSADTKIISGTELNITEIILAEKASEIR